MPISFTHETSRDFHTQLKPIVITIYAKKRVASAEICRRDNTSDVVEIAHRADGSEDIQPLNRSE
jgi:hypothetical protein